MVTRAKFIEVYQAKARENLREAAACLKSGLARATISRAYYALYQAASGGVVHRKSDSSFDADWPNPHHEDVDRAWRGILGEIREECGVESDFDGHTIYGALKSLRVRVDYKPRLDPTMEDAETALDGATRAVGWLLTALRKAGR